MGTRFAIMARVRGASQVAAVDGALDHVAVLERLWSPWIATSDLARLNSAAPNKAVVVAPRTAQLLRRAVALCHGSKGAFDATFFSLHGLWPLKKRPFIPPSAAAIAARLPDVGCDNVRVGAKANTARRRRVGTAVHLGGNAKGTALDEAAALLVRAGVQDFVVDGGGDLVTRGGGPKGVWRVGIKRPRGGATQVAARLQLSRGEAVATSGDYERFVVHQGRRYHHILDPRTGVPVQATHQVTIVTPPGPHAGERADGLATAVFVLGPRHGLALIAQQTGVDALIIDAQGRWHFSPGMRERLGGGSQR